jgi:hypothetical protein
MIISAISIVGVISGLLFGRNNFQHWFPVHISTGSAVVSGLIAIVLLLVYFYFSYQLLLGTQSVSICNGLNVLSRMTLLELLKIKECSSSFLSGHLLIKPWS